MKRSLHWLSSWWFATMTPAYGVLTTIEARETMRKRRLLSIVLFFAFFSLFLVTLAGIFSRGSVEELVQNLWGCSTMLIAGWINRCGYLKWAGIFYFITALFGISMIVSTLALRTPVLSLCLWPIFLILPVVAQLILPAWGPISLTVLTNGFMIWFVLIGRQSQVAFYLRSPADQLVFLVIISVIIQGVGIFCALAAASTRRAIIQADRAFEIEQAHKALAEAYATIQKQALTDALTGLPNHRAVMDQFSKELERTRRYQRSLSVLFFDADRFKQVNDTHGHAAGDAVLQQIGERAGSALRGGDTLGRFGGEEFVILLPEADGSEASRVAERIRASIAAGPMATLDVEGGIVMTVSIGLSTYLIDGDSEQALLSQADEAMYVAKRMGRNQVRTAEEARKMSTDLELMALLQQEGQRDATLREGVTLEQLRETYTLHMISSLLSLLERRDEGLSAHAHAVSEHATALAQRMELPAAEVSRIGIAALLHDIGRVAIPDRILQKAEPLSAAEYALLEEHMEVGAQILETSPFLSDLAAAVRHHHEHWDGSGVPGHLRGEAIPLAARIIAVAEAYDFMQRDYPYQAGRSAEAALAELRRCMGTQFDPAVVQAFCAMLVEQQDRQISATMGRVIGV